MDQIENYLQSLKAADRAALERIRNIVHNAVPEAQEAISYGMPAFKFNKKYLIGFAAYKNHLSVFPTPGPIEALKAKLTNFKQSKGAIQFTLENPLPEAIIIQLVQHRLAQITSQ